MRVQVRVFDAMVVGHMHYDDSPAIIFNVTASHHDRICYGLGVYPCKHMGDVYVNLIGCGRPASVHVSRELIMGDNCPDDDYIEQVKTVAESHGFEVSGWRFYLGFGFVEVEPVYCISAGRLFFRFKTPLVYVVNGTRFLGGYGWAGVLVGANDLLSVLGTMLRRFGDYFTMITDCLRKSGLDYPVKLHVLDGVLFDYYGDTRYNYGPCGKPLHEVVGTGIECHWEDEVPAMFCISHQLV